ncbi:RNA 2',3'-cyclic phosphodiesterase, partial [Candidatus Babeliales bacterium]|nr:RNA 2',3'-cyclic phosphodiesterase [Candidatus Babeliales bacterium]
EKLPDFLGRKTSVENLHLTLKFLGEISEEEIQKIKEQLRKINFNKFKIEINSLGVFSENFIRIIWLHLSNCDALQKEIDRVLNEIGFEKEKRFMSHLTIARVKKIENKNYFLKKLKQINFDKIVFEVDKFKLKESVLSSRGARYFNLETYNLGN